MVLQTVKLDVKAPMDFFKVYLAIKNWTLGKKALTETELEVYAAFMYYDNKYNEVKDEEIRRELLFSSITKRKIIADLNITSGKLETYLNKIRKKGLINENGLLITYRADKNLGLSFVYNMGLNGAVPEYIPKVQSQPVTQTSQEPTVKPTNNSSLDNLYPEDFDSKMKEIAMKNQDIDYENLTDEEREELENLQIIKDLQSKVKQNNIYSGDEI
ncbi:MAG TPA: hypothetical protein VIK84_01220 [Haloplasmataceae bacterium]